MFKLITKPIGCLIKLVMTLISLLVLLIAALLAAFHWGLPSITERTIEELTTFPATIAKTDSSLLSGRIELIDFSINNPLPPYPTADFIYFKRLLVDIDLENSKMSEDEDGARYIEIEELVIDLERFTWVQDDNNIINIEHFIKGIMPKSDSDKPPLKYLIKKLYVRVGKVQRHYKGEMKLYDVNYEHTFTDVHNGNITRIILRLSVDLAAKNVPFVFGGIKDYVLDGLSPGTLYERALEVKDTVEDITDKLHNLF